MSTDRTCNSSFWTKEEDTIFENTLATYIEDGYLVKKMEEALPGKSRDDIINHYNILIEDIVAIESGRVPLPNYPEMQSHSNQKSRFSESDLARRKGIAWTEGEHRSFLQGLAKYGRGDWRSISRHCVLTRTSMQVASHAQKYFKRLKAINKENRRKSIHDITSAGAGAEAAGTSLAPNTEDMIWSSCGSLQAVASTRNESMLPRERNNAELMIAVAGGESSGHSAACVNGMNSLYPDENDEFILRIDDLIVDPEDASEAGFLPDAGKSLLPSEQPCTAASTGTYSHPITRIGSELEALITKPMEEGYDFTSIFDVEEAPTSHAMLSNADRSGMTSFAAASVGANNAPQNMVADYSRMTSYAVASVCANNAPQNAVADYSGMTSFAAASVSANNAPHNMVTSFAIASIGANNAPQNMVAAHPQLPSVAPSSSSGVGVLPNLNTTVDDL